MVGKKRRKGQAAICPACVTAICFTKRLGQGQFVICRECDSLLQVVSLSPFKLAWAFEDPFNVPDLEQYSLNYHSFPDELFGWH
jgi:hypothetical protein